MWLLEYVKFLWVCSSEESWNYAWVLQIQQFVGFCAQSSFLSDTCQKDSQAHKGDSTEVSPES